MAYLMAYACLGLVVVATGLACVAHLSIEGARAGGWTSPKQARWAWAVVWGVYAVAMVVALALAQRVWPGESRAVAVLGAVSGACVGVVVALGRRSARRAGPIPFGWHTLAMGVVVSGAALLVADTTFGPLLLVGGGLLISYSLIVLRAAASAATSLESGPAPVVYIRGFGDEHRVFRYLPLEVGDWAPGRTPLPWWSSNAASFDLYTADAFDRHIGPLVGLGSPRDVVPTGLGAARLYQPDEAWQGRFLALLDRAVAVVLLPGQASHVAWELMQIRQRGLHRRLYVVTPPASPGTAVLGMGLRLVRYLVRAWAPRASDDSIASGAPALADQLAEAGLESPPDGLAPGTVLSFTEEGRAQVLTEGASEPDEYVTPIARDLADKGLCARGRP